MSKFWGHLGIATDRLISLILSSISHFFGTGPIGTRICYEFQSTLVDCQPEFLFLENERIRGVVELSGLDADVEMEDMLEGKGSLIALGMFRFRRWQF